MSSFKKSRGSIKEYFKWRSERNNAVVEKLDKIKKIKGQKILEIGFGYGSLMKLLYEKGASVVGTEVDTNSYKIAKQLLPKSKKLKLIQVKAETLPFKNASFDIVILFDVIEHVNNPQKMIRECKRILKKNGLLYVEFTPYYSVVGHHLYDYSKLPIHYLPQSFVKQLVFNKQIESVFTPKQYWDQFITLNKLRIASFQSYVSKLVKIDEKFIIKYPDAFEINLPFLNYLGSIKDFFVMSFEGIYRK